MCVGDGARKWRSKGRLVELAEVANVKTSEVHTPNVEGLRAADAGVVLEADVPGVQP